MITAFEVVRYSPAGRDYPTRHICDAIPREVEDFFASCLSPEFYDWLQSVLTPIPPGTVEYDSGETYNTGDTAIRNGCIWVSTIDSNTTDPNEPETTDWELLEKFTDDCANALWEGYLRQILAFRVYMSTIIFTTKQSGAGGIVVNMGDSTGQRAGNKADISDTKTALLYQIEMNVKNMLRWLETKKTDATCTLPFDLLENCNGNCKKITKRSRRFAWKH